ncbi:two-component system, chemotaxis family, response regulator CheB [Acetitomaculum ruminis DSM 5522]|uniref:Protein-glutamate methylesterase/protein-glutamine glutaminase n=1 Tax=Acetitomaculum ruminis DSM 5522 TaxID=1120918 RepID=A0A1I0WEC9_9FIRM|nr:chemotaxis response regulator protein-glutamate methylesterase [Acetitomaculum ruminis]SFA86598.1 two-component system, chemotaxis family, response regulator CheB [Acetitomaculum ruminis DSM 5522]
MTDLKKIRVLVLEDSLMFQNFLVKSLNKDPMIEVVATATDPYEARDNIIKYKPDVMTLDIELPRMNGLEFLRKLMPQYPIATVVFSAMTDKVFDALNAGAVDFVPKPSGITYEEMQSFLENELTTKIKIASTANLSNFKNLNRRNFIRSKGREDIIVAIGASTGGTEAIYDVVKKFDINIPGVVIVQHMPPGFTEMFAQRLNKQCSVAVAEAKTGDRVEPGKVLIAPGNLQMRLIKINGIYQVECKSGPKVNGHRPSVDVLFESVAKQAKNKALGIILTGMGADGAKGLLEMRKAGCPTIGQDEASCVVYGMPKAAYDIGAVQYQVDLAQIARKTYSVIEQM